MGGGRAIRLRATAAALAGLAFLGGCGGGAPARTAPARPAAGIPSCGDLRTRVTGHAGAAAGRELSGLVLSRSRRGLLWSVNDSGNSARLIGLSPAGRVVAGVAVAGAENVDWEDIAAGPGRTLYIGDIGDNAGLRQAVTVYRVPEPGPGATATPPAAAFGLRYPDGPRDAEALLVDPASGALTVVAKALGGTAGVYTADRPVAGATLTMRRAGRVSLGPGEAVTGASMSPDGRTVALRTYAGAFLFRRRGGEPVATALARRPCTAGVSLLGEGQGEGIALRAGGRGFYTVPEGERAAIRLYTPSR